MSTEKPRKPFGYCRHAVSIGNAPSWYVDGGSQYGKYFQCGCECHTEKR